MLTKKTIKIILAFTLLLIFFLGYHHYYTQPRMTIFDVGQGDAIFFRTADGEDVLIDGGPDKTVLSKLDRYMPFWDRDIELMILTHPHADHVYGLNEVLKRYDVDQAMMTGIRYNDPAYAYFLDLVTREQAEIIYPEDISSLDFTGLSFDILFPRISFQQTTIDNLNNSSIVLVADFQDIQILLTGDAEQEVEAELAEQYDLKNFEIDILKSGHHGSKTSSSQVFLEEVNPVTAIISCGIDNRFNHPSLRTVSRLERQGIDIWRTDLDGDFVLSLANWK